MKATIGALFFIAVALATIEVEGGQPKFQIEFKKDAKSKDAKSKDAKFEDAKFKDAKFPKFKKALRLAIASAAAAERYGSVTHVKQRDGAKANEQRDGAKVSNEQRDGAKANEQRDGAKVYELEELDASPARKERTGSSWIAARLFSFTIFLAAAVTLISWIIQKKKKACYKKASFSEK